MCAVRSLGQQVPRTCAPRESSPLFMAQARKSINRIELKIENLCQTEQSTQSAIQNVMRRQRIPLNLVITASRCGGASPQVFSLRHLSLPGPYGPRGGVLVGSTAARTVLELIGSECFETAARLARVAALSGDVGTRSATCSVRDHAWRKGASGPAAARSGAGYIRSHA